MTKILLVEDDKSLREIYGVRLQAEGYEIVSAGDGEEALAMAIKEKPELILSDVMMPKISGFDMLDILRSTSETKNVRVIMMTALSSEDQRARGEALGADRYLVKSQVGIEDVVRTVHDVLEDKAATTPAAPVFPPATAPTAPAEPAPQTPDSTPAPAPTPEPQPSPDFSTPFAQEPAPAPQPAARPVAPSVPPQAAPPVINLSENTPSAPPVSVPLPAPTAPFSTPRPGSSEPNPTAPQPDIASEINQALAGNDQPLPPPAATQ